MCMLWIGPHSEAQNPLTGTPEGLAPWDRALEKLALSDGGLQGLLTLPLPNSLTLDHLDHPPHLESGTGNIFASCIASLKKNSISTHLSSPLYVLLYFYIGKLLTFWWRQHFHVNFPPWSSCLMHSCFPHVREKAIRRVSLAIIFPYWVT